MPRALLLTLLVAAVLVAGCGGCGRRRCRPGHHHGGDDGGVVEGRADHGPRPARRRRLQRARLPRPQARQGGARDRGSRDRVGIRRRLHPEHDLARAPGLRPDHRRGLRPGRRGRQGGAAFPDARFAIIDVDHEFVPGKPGNVQGLLFREEEVGYLVGYLAGTRGEASRRPGRDQRRRRLQGAAGRPLHRGLSRRCTAGRARDRGDLELLAGLGRPGEVQGARAEPDRGAARASSSRSRAAAGSVR